MEAGENYQKLEEKLKVSMSKRAIDKFLLYTWCVSSVSTFVCVCVCVCVCEFLSQLTCVCVCVCVCMCVCVCLCEFLSQLMF